MFQILNFSEKFCWRRKVLKLADKSFFLMAGDTKKDAYELDLESAIRMQGYLIGENFLYMVPSERGVFQVHDMIFAVNKLGVWCGFK